MAIEAVGQPTNVDVYAEVIGPFLKSYVPDIEYRLQRLRSAVVQERRKKQEAEERTAFHVQESTAHHLSFSDLLLWAVLVGDVALAEVFWGQYYQRGDPIRLALLAAQTSMRAAESFEVERAKYRKNAAVFEGWACELLSRCDSENDAMELLLRPHDHWPQTILGTAMRNDCKRFIGETLVRRIVDRQWRGNTYHSSWELPEHPISIWQILMHCVIPDTIKMQPCGRNPACATPASLRRTPSSKRFDEDHPLSPGVSLARQRSFSLTNLPEAARLFRSESGRLHGPLAALRSCLRRQAASRRWYQTLKDVEDGVGGGGHTGKVIQGKPVPEGEPRAGWRGFLMVPRVKFTLKLFSHTAFLGIYVAVLIQRHGFPSTRIEPLDVLFYSWALALFVEEIYQWELDARRDRHHLFHRRMTTHGTLQFDINVWNVLDVFTLTLLLIIFAMRLTAASVCEDPYDLHAVHPSGELAGADYAEVWHQLYADCSLLWVSQLLLSFNVILCFMRVLNWLTVWEGLGTLSVILMALFRDVQVFLMIFALVLGGFAAAFIGLMPTLGLSEFDASGPLQSPFWAMFGEFGELDALSRHGSWAGTGMLWMWTFVAQVLLVNLLIAMMTETYSNIKKEEGHMQEYQFQRIKIVDEFMGSVSHIPPPFSMPLLLWELAQAVPRWIHYWCDKRPDLLSMSLTIADPFDAMHTHGHRTWLDGVVSHDHDHKHGGESPSHAHTLDHSHEHSHDNHGMAKVGGHEHERDAVEPSADGGCCTHQTGGEVFVLDEARLKTALANQLGCVAEEDIRLSKSDDGPHRTHVVVEIHLRPELSNDEARSAQIELHRMASSCGKASEILAQTVVQITRPVVQRRACKVSNRPRPPHDAEDLMSFHLPRADSDTWMSNTRRDLIMLKELVEEKAARQTEATETRMLDRQQKVLSEMLRTQEATFTLKKRIEGLMTRVGEVIESGSSSGAPPHLLSQASTGAEAPSEPPKLQRRNTHRLSMMFKSFGGATAPDKKEKEKDKAASPSKSNTENAASGLVQQQLQAAPPALSFSTGLSTKLSSGRSDAPTPSGDVKQDSGGDANEEEDDDMELDETKRLQRELDKRLDMIQSLKQKLVSRDARVHINARSKHPAYPERATVPGDRTEWSVAWPDYSPVDFTHKVVFDNDVSKKANGWADPPNVKKVEWQSESRVSYEGSLVFTLDGLPRNPRGRTGMIGRGLLGKWGPNHAADPIVTRYDPARPRGPLQMVAIRRRDTGDWAIPGGMVDAGETVSVTVKREFMEEAGNLVDKNKAAQHRALVDELFASGQVVYRGYVDDPRNTDHAWMETTAYHFHCNATLGAMLPLASGDDAAAVMWLDVDENNEKYAKLYASHRQWVDKIAAQKDAERLQAADEY